MLRINLGRKGWVNPYFLAMGKDLLRSSSVTTVLALRWDPVPVAEESKRYLFDNCCMCGFAGALATGRREVCP